MAPKKKATATVGKKRGPKPGKKAATAAAAAAGERKRFNTPMDEENRKLFLNVHLPEIKKLRDRVNSAVGTLRKAYKSAKAEGSFTKADFDTALEMEDAEREARAKARIARQLVIARYMGAGLGAQLDLFMEPDRTPAVDIAFDEGKKDALENKPAKPKYDPSTEQHRNYMEGYHSVSEQRVKEGIKPTKGKMHPAVAEDQADMASKEEKLAAQRAKDAEAFDEPSSGMAMSRSQFLKEQQARREAAAQQEPGTPMDDDDESEFRRTAH